MMFADLALAKRLEAAEGHACLQFAKARRRVNPGCGSEWQQCAGTWLVFDGVGSPTTQTFGLGLFGEVTAAALEEIESFFFERGSDVQHEVSPFAGVAVLELLCVRGYAPMELSSVMYRQVEAPEAEESGRVRVHVIGPDEAALWGDISARGWSHEHPELRDFVEQIGVVCAAREGSPCFLAELEGEPGAAGVLSMHEGVALFGGAATVAEMRRQGLQGALLRERMRYAHQQGCDAAMMVAEVGSNSQRNAERKGFQIAYTRTKWRKAIQ